MHNHQWFVFSTGLDQVSLLVQCAGCGAIGRVADPTEEEWGRAFHAPSSPYPWEEPERVIVGTVGPWKVVRGLPPRPEDEAE